MDPIKGHTETITANWYINSSLKEVVDKNLQTLKATDRLVDEETSPINEKVTRVEDKIKDLTKERSTIENDRLKEMVERIESHKPIQQIELRIRHRKRHSKTKKHGKEREKR